MAEQNYENLLNLALEATEEEREKSPDLEVGYSAAEREWELIVKYSGSLEEARAFAAQVTELRGGYAVLVVKEGDIPRLGELPQIEYVEKPKRLYFQLDVGRQASCVPPLWPGTDRAGEGLSGRGVLVAVLDSGIDYASADFRREDGGSRIWRLWDQTVPGRPPAGYALGTEYTREQIDEALAREDRRERLRLVPSEDISGHGTAVAGIAAGNGRGSGPRYRGVAWESDLLIVKLGRAREGGFPRTTELMLALNYVVDQALMLGRPLAVNISIGMTYGAHDGSSLLERYIDGMADLWKNVICVGAGNEAAAAGHAAGQLKAGQAERVELAVQEWQTGLSIQLWKSYVDRAEISLAGPSGARVGPFPERAGAQRFRLGGTEILLYYGEPSPYRAAQEIYLELLPDGDYIDSGLWQLILDPARVVEGSYQMWLPSENLLNRGTGFLSPSEELTLTIPSTAGRVLSVGAYDARTRTYAPFSGRGRPRPAGGTKPDLAAPGVAVTAPAVGGGTVTASGTSFAAPFVTGAAALLMEWGIVRGKDPYLYGEKVKAYLRRGAGELPGFTRYPNNQVGYGALCVRESLPADLSG